MNKIPIGIIGAGGHTRSILNSVDTESFHIQGIYDDNYNKDINEIVCEIPLVGKVADIPQKIQLVLSIGDNKKREKLFFKHFDRILKENIIHKTAIIEGYVRIGNSNQILANCYINAYSSIGNNNLINTGCIIEHETSIGNHNHLSVGSVICGRVTIKNECFIGAGSVIINNISICDNVIIGANAVVISNITEPGVYVGNPTRKVK